KPSSAGAEAALAGPTSVRKPRSRMLFFMGKAGGSIGGLFDLRRGIARLQAQGPLDAAENVRLIRFIFPNVFSMAQRSVEDIALPMLLAPGDRETSEEIFLIGVFVQ